MNGFVYDEESVDRFSVYMWQDMIDYKTICIDIKTQKKSLSEALFGFCYQTLKLTDVSP